VPYGEFCNLCGQNLGGIALNLRQLALAGGDFWVTATASPPTASEGVNGSVLEPDESMLLDEAELPDWLKELPVESAPPEIQTHTYPSLKPIAEEEGKQGRFMVLLFILLALLLLSLIAAAGFLLMRGV